MNLSRTIAGLLATAFGLTILTAGANAQVLPRNKAQDKAPANTPAANAPVAPQPVAPAPGETAGQTRREGRQEARDARADARAAGETGPQARETARETRQETRQNIQASRGADYGLWFNAQANNGLIVSDIATNSVFTNVGLREGDRIVSINGQPVTSEAQFVQFLSSPTIGTQPIVLIVMRNGQQVTLNVQPNLLTQGVVAHDPLYQYGLVLDNRNPNQIIVQQVYPRTPAYYAGIRQGDVITSLGGQAINSVNAFTQGLTQATGNVPLAITRSGQTRNVELQAVQAGEGSVRTALRPNLDAAASGNLSVDAASAAARGNANINAPAGAAINAQGGANATTPAATQPAHPQAVPPTDNAPSPAQPQAQPAPQPKAGANASGAAGTSGTAGANAGGSAKAGTSGPGASGSAGVNAPGAAAGTSGNATAPGTVAPATGGAKVDAGAKAPR